MKGDGRKRLFAGVLPIRSKLLRIKTENAGELHKQQFDAATNCDGPPERFSCPGGSLPVSRSRSRSRSAPLPCCPFRVRYDQESVICISLLLYICSGRTVRLRLRILLVSCRDRRCSLLLLTWRLCFLCWGSVRLVVAIDGFRLTLYETSSVSIQSGQGKSIWMRDSPCHGRESSHRGKRCFHQPRRCWPQPWHP